MTQYFTEEQENQWQKSQPKKLVGAKVIVKSKDDNVLLLKPTYKPTWQLPGGVVEAGESPAVAAAREVCEETGITCDENDLKLADVIFRPKQDILFVLYELALLPDETDEIQLPGDELEGYEWVSPDQVAKRLPDYYAEFWQRYTE